MVVCRGRGRCKILGVLMPFPCGTFFQSRNIGGSECSYFTYLKKYWGYHPWRSWTKLKLVFYFVFCQCSETKGYTSGLQNIKFLIFLSLRCWACVQGLKCTLETFELARSEFFDLLITFYLFRLVWNYFLEQRKLSAW